MLDSIDHRGVSVMSILRRSAFKSAFSVWAVARCYAAAGHTWLSRRSLSSWRSWRSLRMRVRSSWIRHKCQQSPEVQQAALRDVRTGLALSSAAASPGRAAVYTARGAGAVAVAVAVTREDANSHMGTHERTRRSSSGSTEGISACGRGERRLLLGRRRNA